ncbi:MAG: hypothetical protein EZS28_029555 [Streblomastix strix]|uniref:Uncharacterized protein n=1 Tax=Streblomastix strix TaxID=222440 RepID=A0A5J4UYE4_9EUKA|nr:MAG: hypothetical protein EZS28_029555 [Streblomastix strix]
MDKAKTKAIKKIKQHDESVVETILNVHCKHLLQIQQVITIPKDKLIQIQQQSDVGMNSSSAISLKTRYIVDALALQMSTRILKDDVSHEDMKDVTSNENKPSRIQPIPLDHQQSPVQSAINKFLLKQYESLDEAEAQFEEAENVDDLQNHYDKLFEMQNFVGFSGQNSAPMIALMASSSSAQPDIDQIYPYMEL